MRQRTPKSLALVVGATACIAAARVASATTTTSLVLSPDQPSAAAIAEDPTLQNRTTFDLVMTSTADWTNSTLKFTLTDGSFYNAVGGGNVPTNVGSWSSAGFMHLRYDSFVARPPDFLTAPIVAGRHPIDGAGPAIFSSSTTSVSWLDTSSAYPPGTYTIARLTVSNDAVGSFFGNSFDSSLPGTPQPYDDALNKQLRWDTDPISVGAQGGSGTWDTAASNFWNGNFNVAWNNVRNDVAIFDEGFGAVSVGAVIASAIRFESPGYTLGSGAVTLVGFARITTDEDATINSSIISSVGLIKDGPATLTINSALGGVTGDYQIDAGHLNVNDLQGTSNVTVAAGAGLTANHVRQSALTLAGPGATTDIRANGTFAGTSVVNTLTLDGGSTPTARVDLRNNALIIDHSGASPISTVAAQIAAAFNGGSWNGNGITSSLANNSTHGVGFAERSALTTVPAIFGSVDGTAVLARYTRFGDADLNGVVNLDDFNRLAGNFGQTNRFWHQGDFTYNGIVNLDDFNRLAANFGLTVGPAGPTPEDWAELATRVPEPSSFILASAGTLLTLRRRRNRATV